MINREKTSKIVEEWKDFLNGRSNHSERRCLNESPRDDIEENEALKALTAHYRANGLTEEQIDNFVSASELIDPDTLQAMADSINPAFKEPVDPGGHFDSATGVDPRFDAVYEIDPNALAPTPIVDEV
jgi:hypothetical protein